MIHSLFIKFKEYYHLAVRNILKAYLTNHLGPVIEDDQQITCYVDKKKCHKDNSCYTIPCFNRPQLHDGFLKHYQLNKPVCYVLDGLEFDKHVITDIGNYDFHIKNCKFNAGLIIQAFGKCTIQDTMISGGRIFAIYADEINLKNSDINNSLASLKEDFYIHLNSSTKMDISNSNIGKESEHTIVSLTAKEELKLTDTKVAGDTIKYQSKVAKNTSNSSLDAGNDIHIMTDDVPPISFTAPTIVYNNHTFSAEDKSTTLEALLTSLKTKRLELLTLLKNIKQECESSLIEQSLIDQQPSRQIVKKNSK